MILNGTEGRMEITSKGLHSFGYDLNESRNVRIFNRQGEEIRKSPIDIGLIGIGENGHIAFNDPPADFDTKEAYIIVNHDERCKKQQMCEGWFATIDDVPKQAVSMTTYQIMQCQRIISCVPYKVKAEAVENTLKSKEVTNMIPATLLKTHPDFILYVDENSAAGIVNY